MFEIKEVFYYYFITTLFQAGSPYCLHCAFIDDFWNGANSVECYIHFDVPANFLEFSSDSHWYVCFFFKLAMIKQPLSDVCWGDLDYQIINWYTFRYDNNIKYYYQRLVAYWCVMYNSLVVNVVHSRSIWRDSRPFHGSLYCVLRWETCNASCHIGGEISTNKLLGNLNCTTMGIQGGIQQLPSSSLRRYLKGQVTILHATETGANFPSSEQIYSFIVNFADSTIVHIHFAVWSVLLS